MAGRDSSLHKGHRARLIEQYTKIDFEDLSEHQVLEFLLFYIYPRCDTNEIAHRLLNKFVTFPNVLIATEADLMQVDGVSRRTAKMLRYFPKLFSYYSSSIYAKKSSVASLEEICERFESVLRHANTELLYVIAISNSKKQIAMRNLAEGNGSFVHTSISEISNIINAFQPAYLAIGHNHPGGSCVASREDIASTEAVKKFVNFMDVKLIDHIIVGEDGVYSIMQKKKLIEYEKAEMVKNQILKDFEMQNVVCKEKKG